MTTAASPRHLVIDATGPYDRGRTRGRHLADAIAGTLDMYQRLFATLGLGEPAVRTHATRLIDAVGDWHRDTVTELVGVADGSGLELWQVMALNGRTEILAEAGAAAPECSTLVADSERTSLSPLGIQTWDWHTELGGYWHTQSVTDGDQGYVGVTESGILAKIGINGAGLGLFFNILAHRLDGAEAVPIHLLAARVLAGARSVAEAIEVIRATPLASSGALTLVDPESAACVEISPLGVTVLGPTAGHVAHTNHFLATANRLGARAASYDEDSRLRLALIDARMAGADDVLDAAALTDLLRSGPGDPQLCCTPAPGAAFGNRWRTLATVILDPRRRIAAVRSGSPNDDSAFRTMEAPSIRLGATRGGSA